MYSKKDPSKRKQEDDKDDEEKRSPQKPSDSPTKKTKSEDPKKKPKETDAELRTFLTDEWLERVWDEETIRESQENNASDPTGASLTGTQSTTVSAPPRPVVDEDGFVRPATPPSRTAPLVREQKVEPESKPATPARSSGLKFPELTALIRKQDDSAGTSRRPDSLPLKDALTFPLSRNERMDDAPPYKRLRVDESESDSTPQNGSSDTPSTSESGASSDSSQSGTPSLQSLPRTARLKILEILARESVSQNNSGTDSLNEAALPCGPEKSDSRLDTSGGYDTDAEIDNRIFDLNPGDESNSGPAAANPPLVALNPDLSAGSSYDAGTENVRQTTEFSPDESDSQSKPAVNVDALASLTLATSPEESGYITGRESSVASTSQQEERSSEPSPTKEKETDDEESSSDALIKDETTEPGPASS